MTSVKIRTSWTDENVVTEGVRIYKSDQEFDVNTRPLPLVEITDGSDFYEDFDVEEGEKIYYMLSCFLGSREIFTECYEVTASLETILDMLTEYLYSITAVSTIDSVLFSFCSFNLDGSRAFIASGSMSAAGELAEYQSATAYTLQSSDTKLLSYSDPTKGANINGVQFFGDGSDLAIIHAAPWTLTHYKLSAPFDISNPVEQSVSSIPAASVYLSQNGMYAYIVQSGTATIEVYVLAEKGNLNTKTLLRSVSASSLESIGTRNRVSGVIISSDGLSSWIALQTQSSNNLNSGAIVKVDFSEAYTFDPAKKTYSALRPLPISTQGIQTISKAFGSAKRFSVFGYNSSNAQPKNIFYRFT